MRTYNLSHATLALLAVFHSVQPALSLPLPPSFTSSPAPQRSSRGSNGAAVAKTENILVPTPTSNAFAPTRTLTGHDTKPFHDQQEDQQKQEIEADRQHPETEQLGEQHQQQDQDQELRHPHRPLHGYNKRHHHLHSHTHRHHHQHQHQHNQEATHQQKQQHQPQQTQDPRSNENNNSNNKNKPLLAPRQDDPSATDLLLYDLPKMILDTLDGILNPWSDDRIEAAKELSHSGSSNNSNPPATTATNNNNASNSPPSSAAGSEPVSSNPTTITTTTGSSAADQAVSEAQAAVAQAECEAYGPAQCAKRCASACLGGRAGCGECFDECSAQSQTCGFKIDEDDDEDDDDDDDDDRQREGQSPLGGTLSGYLPRF